MNYEFPLLEEETKVYIVSGDVNIDDVLDCRPGGLMPYRQGETIYKTTTIRQWWEPIEDEV